MCVNESWAVYGMCLDILFSCDQLIHIYFTKIMKRIFSVVSSEYFQSFCLVLFWLNLVICGGRAIEIDFVFCLNITAMRVDTNISQFQY